jgi:hypothetical protein
VGETQLQTDLLAFSETFATQVEKIIQQGSQVLCG